MKRKQSSSARSVLSLFLCLLLIFSVMCTTAFAATNDSARLEATYAPDDEPEYNVAFDFYKIAEHVIGNKYNWVAPYGDYRVTVPDYDDAQGMADFVSTMANYIKRDELHPDLTKRTDKNGVIDVTGLEEAMYIIIGESTERDGYRYNPVPFLVFYPFRDVDGELSMNAEGLEVKYTKEKLEGVLEDRHVLKSWMGGSSEDRPDYVKVDLLQDGHLYDQQILSARNNWRHTWEDLDQDYEWTLVETDVQGSYTTATRLEGATFVVTNTYVDPGNGDGGDDDKPDPNPPGPGTNPNPPGPGTNPPGGNRPSQPSTPSNPGGNNNNPGNTGDNPGGNTSIPDNDTPLGNMPDLPDTPDNPFKPDGTPTNDNPGGNGGTSIPDNDVPLGNIPQTGQLWWPVWLMVALGVLCITLGFWAPWKRKNV